MRKKQHKVGDEVIIIANTTSHAWSNGTHVIVKTITKGELEDYIGHTKDQEGIHHHTWYFNDVDCEAVTPETKYHPSGKLISAT